MAIRELEGNRVEVVMSMSQWNLMQQLEKSYKIARAIVRAQKQCETAPSLSVKSAMSYIDSL